MKILGRNFVFGRDHRRSAEARRARARARASATASTCSARRRKTFEDAERYAEAYRWRARPHRQGSEGRLSQVSPGISVKLTALHPRYEWSHADEAVAAVLPVVRELALKASQGRRPFHHRRRGSRPARAADGRVRGAARRRRAVRQRLGRVRDRDPGLSEARRAAVRLGRRGGAGARPQADGPAGQGRLLGHRDQGRAGRRAARLSGVHPQGRDRRLLSRLRQEAARGRATSSIPAFAHPQRQHDRRRSRRWPKDSRSSSSACTAWARSCTRSWPSSRRRSATSATPVRIYAPVGSHKELLAYLVRRLLENGANSQLRQPHRRRAGVARRAGPRSGRRARGARAQAQSEDRPSARDLRRRRGATAPASICPTRWCASRCSSG